MISTDRSGFGFVFAQQHEITSITSKNLEQEWTRSDLRAFFGDDARSPPTAATAAPTGNGATAGAPGRKRVAGTNAASVSDTDNAALPLPPKRARTTATRGSGRGRGRGGSAPAPRRVSVAVNAADLEPNAIDEPIPMTMVTVVDPPLDTPATLVRPRFPHTGLPDTPALAEPTDHVSTGSDAFLHEASFDFLSCFSPDPLGSRSDRKNLGEIFRKAWENWSSYRDRASRPSKENAKVC
ncbi:hypothetical protein BC828DRAFT_133057 [Blastocladiella britannica]|nr:hypothetical protein BC828DRAFT_133057 [Blastocladiella britannica]